MSTIHIVPLLPEGGGDPRKGDGGMGDKEGKNRNMVVQIRVIMPYGEEEIMELCDTEEQLQSITVLQLKKKIHERFSYRVQENVRLVFRTEALEDSSLLTSYGIRHMSVIHMVLFLPGGGGGPGWGDGGMGDKEGKNRSMERLFSL